MKPGSTQRKRALPAFFLVLISLVIYWPSQTWFQSDDFIAVTYAGDPTNLSNDFLGPQYSLETTALFWRPLITASLGLDRLFFGGDPFGYHLNNTLFHGLNTLLVLLILARLLDWSWAVRATLLWVLHPAHAVSVTWIVGRVDVHSVFWSLLALALHQRWERGNGTRLPAILAFALSLATKELAICFPFLVAALAFFQRPGWQLMDKVAGALRQALPYIVILVVYMFLRLALLGEFIGGYLAAKPLAEILPDLPHDFSIWLGRLFLPLGSPLGDRLVGWAIVAAWIAGAIWLLLTLQQLRRDPEPGRGKGLLLAGAFFLSACIPMVAIFNTLDNITHLRIFYLPLVGLMAIGAGAGWRPAILLAALMIPIHLPVRQDINGAMEFNRNAHMGILTAARDHSPDRPLFIQGLACARGMGYRLDKGTDRLLVPPFGNQTTPVYPWRQLQPGQPTWSPEEVDFPRKDLLVLDSEGKICRTDPGADKLPIFPITTNISASLGREELLQEVYGSKLHLQTNRQEELPYLVMIFTGHGYAAGPVASDKEGRITLFDILIPAARFIPLAVALDLDRCREYRILLLRLGPDGKPKARADHLIPIKFNGTASEILRYPAPAQD